jgi:hypothetical protein
MKKTFGLSLLALIVALAFAATPVAAAEPVSAVAAPATSCGQGLDLIGREAQGEICPAAQPESLVPEFMAKPPHHGYCKCGCGAGCTTDADCGPGGQCVRFITCC